MVCIMGLMNSAAITNGTETLTFTLDGDSIRIDGATFDGRPMWVDREVGARTLAARLRMGWRREALAA